MHVHRSSAMALYRNELFALGRTLGRLRFPDSSLQKGFTIQA